MKRIFNLLTSIRQNLPFVYGKTFKKQIIDYKNTFIQYKPDRYSLNLKKYEKLVNFFSPDDLKYWNKGNYLNNAGDISRFYFLNLCIDQLLQEGINGNVAELGVYKGNSAYLLAKYARRINTTLFLFDTFKSFDHKDLSGIDKNADADTFSDTSLNYVREIIGDSNVKYIQGYFPESLSQVNDLQQFSLVHLDCDLEKPFTAGLNYFYPKLMPGGFLIMHDYSSLFWPGAPQAINNFFKDKKELLIPIPDKSGTAVIRKI